MNEREAFEAYWNSLVTPTGASEELLHSCEFAAWYAWQAALAQPAVQGEPVAWFCGGQGNLREVERWAKDAFPVYRHPPSQPPREPLTDARIAELEEAMWYIKMNAGRGDLVYAKARAVLAAAQEKKP